MRTQTINAETTTEVTFKLRGVAQPAEPDVGISSGYVEDAEIEDICIVRYGVLPGLKHTKGHYSVSIMTDIDWKNPEIIKLLGNIQKIIEREMLDALAQAEVG